MANFDLISRFNGNYLAFYKPVKRAYFLLKWDAIKGKWVKNTTNHGDNPTITMHETENHNESRVRLSLHSGHRSLYIQVQAECKFLKIAGITQGIPILKRVNGSAAIPRSFMNIEYVCEHNAGILNENLWSIVAPAPAPAPAPTVPVPVNLIPPPTAVVLEALPKRIAWLIAEDAQRNNDTCSITLEPINPITASVTSCFHCFDSTAIETWLINNSVCPMCKKKCVAIKAFTEN